MRVPVVTLMILLISAAAHGEEKKPADSPQPPQLLGVWYGVYDSPNGGGTCKAEMWMEISYQLSVNGYDIRGHNRWNVLDEENEQAHGEKSLGRHAEYFDTFSGRIAHDDRTVEITEDNREGHFHARLAGKDSLEANYYPEGAKTPSFSVRLKRIDTHYSPTEINVLGIDVSHHSGNVDWPRVKEQGFRFAYVKASEGVDNLDAMFETHWKALRDLGMPRGAYHFYVTEDDPVEQAKFFASRLREDPGTLPPAVDVELLGSHTTGDMTEELLLFLRTLEKEIGVKPLIYTNTMFWDKNYRPEFSEYQLWMSEYGVKVPKVPFGWKNWLLWQTADDRKVDGVEKDADISMIHPSIDLHTLQAKDSAAKE